MATASTWGPSGSSGLAYVTAESSSARLVASGRGDQRTSAGPAASALPSTLYMGRSPQKMRSPTTAMGAYPGTVLIRPESTLRTLTMSILRRGVASELPAGADGRFRQTPPGRRPSRLHLRRGALRRSSREGLEHAPSCRRGVLQGPGARLRGRRGAEGRHQGMLTPSARPGVRPSPPRRPSWSRTPQTGQCARARAGARPSGSRIKPSSTPRRPSRSASAQRRRRLRTEGQWGASLRSDLLLY